MSLFSIAPSALPLLTNLEALWPDDLATVVEQCRGFTRISVPPNVMLRESFSSRRRCAPLVFCVKEVDAVGGVAHGVAGRGASGRCIGQSDSLRGLLNSSSSIEPAHASLLVRKEVRLLCVRTHHRNHPFVMMPYMFAHNMLGVVAN